MSDLDLDKLEQLAKAANPRPWCLQCVRLQIRHINKNCDVYCENGDCVELGMGRYDGEFIAAICDAAIDLIAAARERDELTKLLKNK